MRYDELRKVVQDLMQRQLERNISLLNEKGPEQGIDVSAWHNMRDFLSEGPDLFWQNMGAEQTEYDVARVAKLAHLSPKEREAHRAEILKLLHQGYQAFWDALEGRRKELDGIALPGGPEAGNGLPAGSLGLSGASAPVTTGKTVFEAVRAYVDEQKRAENWTDQTREKRERVVSRMLWKFPGSALRACGGSVFHAARSRGIGSMG